MPETVQQAVGCVECRQTGYRGRVGLYEILRLTPAMRAHIGQQINTTAIQQLAFADGMQPLRISGAKKIQAGLTTIDEVLRVVPLTSEA